MSTKTMDVSVLQASRVEPRILDTDLEPLISTLAPIYNTAQRVQAVIGAVAVQALLNAYFAACFSLQISKIIAIQTLLATQLGASITSRAIQWMWSSTGAVAMREAMFISFAKFILGSGNSLILVVFWPGWWVIGGTSWAVWIVYG